MKISKSKLKSRIINGNKYLVYRFMRDGKSKSIYGKSYTEIQKKYDKYLKENDINNSSTKTFDYYFNKYLHEKRCCWKIQTYKSRLNFYEKHIKTSILAKKKFSKVNKSDISTFIEKLELSNSTKREKLQVLKQFYNWCIENDCCNNNPCTNITVKVRDYDDKEVISANTVNQILNDVHGKDIEPVIILLCFGCRLGEAMAANKEQLDVEGILITESLTKVSVGGYTKTFLEAPKTRESVRKVILPSEVIETLKRCSSAIDGYYCKTIHGWMSRNRIYHFLSKYNVTPHDLRKFYCTNLLMNNVNIYTVKNQLGHSKSSTYTEKYYLLKDSDKIKNDMNNYFK